MLAPQYLQKFDPVRNMARFYRVDVAPTLFGESSVVRTWGRIGTLGRTALETFPTLDAAEAAGLQTVRTKLRRGYVVASGSGGRAFVDRQEQAKERLASRTPN
ncbi:MAG: WGR domain-containing protein [Pseudotabrizicola sp.]|uniref:WGR domain-containing protein n=1 Tax=Pseudotabrizicola sp. TaxID=2939647 RepID=UPI00272671F2|nr:WGR domain-containing protein [Pseudotabrizicola sp.]MDO9641211.1 WGR domain-containing protein [Pseudotabrizicola sp.]